MHKDFLDKLKEVKVDMVIRFWQIQLECDSARINHLHNFLVVIIFRKGFCLKFPTPTNSIYVQIFSHKDLSIKNNKLSF